MDFRIVYPITQGISKDIISKAGALERFRFTVETTGAAETFTIPCQDVGTFNATVDWGDGSESTITTYNDADLAHEYATAGEYQITIIGTFPNIYFNNGGDRLKVISVEDLGDVGWLSFQGAFYGCSNITAFGTDTVDTSNVTDMSSMFNGLTLTTPPDLSRFNTSSVTDMNRMFANMGSLTSPPDVSGFDTSSVTDFTAMFDDMGDITSPPDVSGFNTELCENMNFMFSNLLSITSPPDVSGFDTSNVTSMQQMFSNLPLITSPPDTSGFDTGSVINMIRMFFGMSSTSFTASQGISSWDIGALISATEMFDGTSITTSEYDDILVNCETQDHQNNVNIHFGSSTYTSGGAAETARTALVGDGWTIADDGAA